MLFGIIFAQLGIVTPNAEHVRNEFGNNGKFSNFSGSFPAVVKHCHCYLAEIGLSRTTRSRSKAERILRIVANSGERVPESDL